MRKVNVKLKNGHIVSGDEFDNNDYLKLKEIFKKWQNINKDLKELGGRNLNVPDVFSEALFCIFFDSVRTNNTAHSYDCVSKKAGQGIQIKSASIPNDCTSFGPKSTWDEIYYVDFAPNGYVDGNVYFYKIKDSIYDIILNESKHETFAEQQQQGRRPRFSIQNKIIKPQNLKPVLKIDLNK